MAKYIWIATYENVDLDVDLELKLLATSTSLLELQTYVLKKASIALKGLGDDYKLVRLRRGNVITFKLQSKGVAFSEVEWWMIRRVRMIG